LGVDLSPDKKQCNFDCLYCELKGAKSVQEAQNTPHVELVLEALKESLAKHQEIDVITLTANGEPTLYPDLRALVEGINAIKGNHKLLILSNGSTIANPTMQQILSHMDIVKLSLDCIHQTCFKKLDRAHQSIDIGAIVEGMKVFRKRYDGELVIEILVVKGMNDSEEEFEALNEALHVIQPNRIDVGTIDRPPAYAVKGVSEERLVALSQLLKGLHVNIAYAKNYRAQKRRFSQEEIVELLKRRPQSFEDIHHCFDEQSVHALEHLVEKSVLHVKRIAGVNFYTCE